jgi:hypothetical protein
MNRTFTRLGRAMAYLRRQLSFDATQRAFFERLKKAQRLSRATPRDVIAVQCVTDDIYYLGLFGQIAASLRETGDVRVDQIATQSLNVSEVQSPFAFAALRLVLNTLLVGKWVRLYRAFCDRVAYRSTSFRLFDDLADLRRARRCWKSLSSRQDLMDLTIDGVPVGDLVNDSYLRFRPAATVDLRSGYLWIVLWQAFRDARRARDYFARVQPKAYLTSYSTYVQHGIAARTALRYGARVFSFGNYQEFSKQLSAEDWTHTRESGRYAADFARLPDRADKLAFSRKALGDRIAGVIDSATSYMKQSAYSVSEEQVPDVRSAVVIFLHDFFDSPHVYKDMVFPDFWEWVCFTIETLQAAGVDFIIKPHPNQIDLSGGVLATLKGRYPGAKIISSKITNKQLADGGVVCAVTVYGTVAHEMAYLGVPTIACARHPHVSFDFCRTARSREEYAAFLREPAKSLCGREQMIEQSLAFYYMHNRGMDDASLQLRDASLDFRRACGAYDATGQGQDLPALLDRMTMLPAYRQYIRSLSAVLASEAPAASPASERAEGAGFRRTQESK